jgi:hypothetical protein
VKTLLKIFSCFSSFIIERDFRNIVQIKGQKNKTCQERTGHERTGHERTGHILKIDKNDNLFNLYKAFLHLYYSKCLVKLKKIVE